MNKLILQNLPERDKTNFNVDNDRGTVRHFLEKLCVNASFKLVSRWV